MSCLIVERIDSGPPVRDNNGLAVEATGGHNVTERVALPCRSDRDLTAADALQFHSDRQTWLIRSSCKQTMCMGCPIRPEPSRMPLPVPNNSGYREYERNSSRNNLQYVHAPFRIPCGVVCGKTLLIQPPVAASPAVRYRPCCAGFQPSCFESKFRADSSLRLQVRHIDVRSPSHSRNRHYGVRTHSKGQGWYLCDVAPGWASTTNAKSG